MVALSASLDIIVSDYRLPGPRTGVAMVESLRLANGRAIPAIIMTGDTQANVVLEVARAGCDILHKPCPAVAVLAAVARLLGGLRTPT